MATVSVSSNNNTGPWSWVWECLGKQGSRLSCQWHSVPTSAGVPMVETAQTPTAIFTTFAYPAPLCFLNHPYWDATQWIEAHGKRLQMNAERLWPRLTEAEFLRWHNVMAELEALLQTLPVHPVKVQLWAQMDVFAESNDGKAIQRLTLHCRASVLDSGQIPNPPSALVSSVYSHPMATLKHNARRGPELSVTPKALPLWVTDVGTVNEAAIANVLCLFKASGGGFEIWVPPLSQRLQGLMEQWCLTQLSSDGVAVKHQPLSLYQFQQSCGVWCSNSLRGVWRAEYLDGQPLPKPWAKLPDALEILLENAL